MPREGRRDGPLPAAQVGGPRARRRGARAARGHARHPPARGRPGRLHRGLQRDRRDDRRRHRLPARRRTTSASSAATSTTACWLQRARRAAGPRARLDQAARPTSCTTSPSRAREPRDPQRVRLDAADPAVLEELRWFRFLIGRIGDYDGIPLVVSRTGYSGELGYEVFCHPSDAPGGLGRDHGGGRAARHQAARARRARHAADRVGADLRRLRVRRPGRPVRGGHRLRGRARRRGGLRRQGGADRAQGAPAARRWSGSSSRATRPPATATACTSAAPRSA